MERGLVITLNYKMLVGPDGRERFNIITGDDPLLRESLLYWDKLASPRLMFADVAKSPAARLLIEEKILDFHNPEYTFPFENIPGSAQLQTFEQFERSAPGVWALAQSGWRLPVPQTEGSIRTPLVELFNALPVPRDDVPIETILRFKEARRSELSELRSRLDDLYQEVLASNDPSHALVAAKEKIESALRAVGRVGSEAMPMRILNSLKVSLNPSQLASMAAVGAASGYLAAPLIHLNPSVAAAAFGAVATMASTISVSLSVGPKLNLSSETKAFAYAHSVTTEL